MVVVHPKLRGLRALGLEGLGFKGLRLLRFRV